MPRFRSNNTNCLSSEHYREIPKSVLFAACANKFNLNLISSRSRYFCTSEPEIRLQANAFVRCVRSRKRLVIVASSHNHFLYFISKFVNIYPNSPLINRANRSYPIREMAKLFWKNRKTEIWLLCFARNDASQRTSFGFATKKFGLATLKAMSSSRSICSMVAWVKIIPYSMRKIPSVHHKSKWIHRKDFNMVEACALRACIEIFGSPLQSQLNVFHRLNGKWFIANCEILMRTTQMSSAFNLINSSSSLQRTSTTQNYSKIWLFLWFFGVYMKN